MVGGTFDHEPNAGMTDSSLSTLLHGIEPQTLVGWLALATVFVTLAGLGASLRPLRVLEERLPSRALVLTLAAALVGVPLATLAIAALTGLSEAALAGILLVGISPGAPLALRRSRNAVAASSYPAILQVAVALLAIPAVPLWILILDWIFGANADIAIHDMAQQVFVSQILPLACGVALALRAPALARTAAGPMMRLGTILMLVLAVTVLGATWRSLAAVPWQAFLSSVSVAVAAIALGHAAGRPDRDTQVAGAVVCALRNPGIALLVASANAFPPAVKAVILAHVFITAIVLTAYLGVMKRGRASTPAPDAASR
jgi:BASS family bile acid:Na+ symporter